MWLWRPFHRCFVRLRRGWDTKSDIIDVFATFFFFNRILYQTVLLIANKEVRHFNESGSVTYHPQTDLSISYRSSLQCSLEALVILIATVFIILPPLLLILYPIKAFRSCISKCRINFIAIHNLQKKCTVATKMV